LRYDHKTDDPRLLGMKLARKLGPLPWNVICIGTDRSTGDALGPLTGSFLQNSTVPGIFVDGDIDDPIHAANLGEFSSTFIPHGPVLAIDACLGKKNNVGTVTLCEEPLRPGAGVKKDLPQIGDSHIAGIVNVGGLMEYYVLQNTRLSIVMSMSHWIAKAVQAGSFLASPEITQCESAASSSNKESNSMKYH